MATVQLLKSTKRMTRKRAASGSLARFRADVKEIAEATEAMRRVRRTIEFEPPRLRYMVGPH